MTTTITKTSRMLRISEVAERLGLHPRTVLKRIHKGDLPATRLGGKWCTWLIDEEDLEKVLDSNRSGGRADPEA